MPALKRIGHKGADLIALERPEDRAEAKQLLGASLATLERKSPPHPRLAEVKAASAKLGT